MMIIDIFVDEWDSDTDRDRDRDVVVGGGGGGRQLVGRWFLVGAVVGRWVAWL